MFNFARNFLKMRNALNEDNVKLNSAKAWMLAARPKTLTGAAVPVMIALALAWADRSAGHPFLWLPALLCMLFAFVMQIDANFVNDYFDFMKGTDDEERLGPRRACANGWVTAKAMRVAMGVTTLLGCIIGLPLIYYGGWEMVVVGLLCVFFCFLYTTHLSYMGMGDLLVLVFFGIVPVCVTYYLQMQTVSWEVFIASLACGLVIDTLLLINNYRDRDNDRRAGKITLVVRVGERGGERMYLWAGLLAFVLGMVFILNGHPFAAILPVLYIFMHFQTYKKMKKINHGRQLNMILGETARNMFVYGLMVTIGLLLSPLKANAQKSEMSRVRVTMNDGTQKEGNVTRYWSDGGGFKVMNRKFRMIENGVEREYTADDVKAVDFVMKNPQSMLNENVVSADVANPTTFSPKKVKRQFVHIEGTTNEGTIYWWNGVDSQQMQLGSLTVSTIFGVKLAGEEIIIPFMTGNVISLNAMRIRYKKTARKELVEYLDKRVLKGGQKLWDKIQRDPMLFLELINEYNNK